MPNSTASVSDVVLRDGLQMIQSVVPTATKIAILDALYAAGLRHLDVASFVPPSRFPQFADGADVVAHGKRLPGLILSAFAPNVRGAERAIAAGVDALSFVVSVSESHNLANVRNLPAEQIEAAKAVRTHIQAGPRPVALVIALATAFGCSIEGRVEPAAVARMAEAARHAGADEICLSDTVGYADPRLTTRVIAEVRRAVGDEVRLRIHLHDTTGTGIANAYAALEAGITQFDAALGGLGGCPFAPGASGNISIEDLVWMMEQSGVSTGIDLGLLLDATRLLHATLPDEVKPSHIFKAGIPNVYRTPL